VILLPSALVHQHQQRMRRRKVKLAVAGACLAGLLVSLLAIAMEPSEAGPGDDGSDFAGDESPFRPSGGGGGGDGAAWFTTTGTGRR
jgi:hypothetical protein